jgi:CheY-like chemotaxis protein
MIILHVDDDAEDREIFSEAIYEVSSSIQCLTAKDGIEALLLLSGEVTYLNLDYIFLDINMPKMDGIALLAAIKMDKRLSHIPVCILSTTCNEKEIASIKSLGAKYTQKQNDFEKTVSILSSILNLTPALH